MMKKVVAMRRQGINIGVIVLTLADEKRLLFDVGMKREELPTISASHPVVREAGARSGQIIKVLQEGVAYPFYRYVE